MTKLVTVEHGKRYRARIVLSGFFEKMASNTTIADKFADAGFSNVQIVGSGGERWAFGTWARDTLTTELPSQVDVDSITEV